MLVPLFLQPTLFRYESHENSILSVLSELHDNFSFTIQKLIMSNVASIPVFMILPVDRCMLSVSLMKNHFEVRVRFHVPNTILYNALGPTFQAPILEARATGSGVAVVGRE